MAQNTQSTTATRNTVPGTANDAPVAPQLFTEPSKREYIPDAKRVGDGAEVPEHMLAGREDLTRVPLPTIDPEDARDHDDAVWVERTASGGYEVWVAIADVSSYVQPGTKIDEEARARGCSIYLPDRWPARDWTRS